MSARHSTLRATRAARQGLVQTELCIHFNALSVQSRCLTSTTIRYATPTLHPTTTKDVPLQSRKGKPNFDGTKPVQPAAYTEMTPAQRAARAAERARDKLSEEQKKYTSSRRLGGLAENSFFADREATQSSAGGTQPADGSDVDTGLSRRAPENMSFALNPRPDARARWQKKMLIRHIRHRGRLPKDIQIARTERSHLSKSHFFKTSMKKLAPLARQISGKSIEEAILQMRFSKKKAAQDVKAHLIGARDEAIVMKGMGLGSLHETTSADSSPVMMDPGIQPPLPHQTPTKSTKAGVEKSETDMYIAQAWVNRGPYGMEPEYRARGKVNILRPPWTGMSVLLKEERTRTREKEEKEAKAIKKRMGKKMWLQMPDRPITRQSQYLLW